MKFTIPHRLPSLNEYTAANRHNSGHGASVKKKAQALIAPYLPSVIVDGRQDYCFTWYCANAKRDPDNIHSAVKFVLDAMVSAGIIENDGWKQVGVVTHRCVLADTDAVEVTLCPCPPMPPAPRSKLRTSPATSRS